VSAGRAIGIVGLCVIGAGLLVNVYLAIVARNVSVADYKNFGAYWSLVLMVGFGAFLPIEQEMARLLHTPDVDHRSVLRVAILAASGFAVIELLVLVATSPLLLDAFGGKTGMLASLGAMCLVAAGQFVVRGALIGTERLGVYGGMLVGDAALRVVLTVVVALTMTTDSTGYSWTLVAAVALVHFPLLFMAYRRAGQYPGTTAQLKPFVGAIAPLLAGSLAAQALLNGVPVLVSASATADQQVDAGRFQAAFLLARIPLFVAVPLQTTILPALTRMFTSDRSHRALRVISRLIAVLGAFGLLGVVVALTIGPWLVALVFGNEYQVSRYDLAIMIVGVIAHVGLIIMTQALVAASLHAQVAWSWLSGLAVAAVVFVLVPGIVLAGELAFLAGSVVGLAVATAQLLIRHGGAGKPAQATQ
jgi:O-antigen/teichoic acid export membrane protein